MKIFLIIAGGSCEKCDDEMDDPRDVPLLLKAERLRINDPKQLLKLYRANPDCIVLEPTLTTTKSGMSAAHAEIFVKERRLRPVYELLDSGNNRKVLAEADKLLKKNAAFSCAKVLKALALIRMNKVDEARILLEPVISEEPTDDATIQALTICFRELDEPQTICAILEAACRKEQSEELLSHCFMAQVRARDYKKQNLTALNLYKLFNKPTYFCWAIASAVLKFENGDPSDASNKISLQVAERMVEKLIAEKTQIAHKDVEESVMGIFHQILFLLEKYDKLLDVLKKQGYPAKWMNDKCHDCFVATLIKLGKLDELMDYFKDKFLKCQDDYGLLRDVIRIFSKDKPDEVDAFLKNVRQHNPGYTIALGDILYCCKESISLASARAVEDIEMAILHGAEKPSFYSAATAYFMKLMGQGEKTDVHRRLVAYLDDPTVPAYANTDNMIRDVNFEMIEKLLLREGDCVQRMRNTNRCFGKYMACEKIVSARRKEPVSQTKESEHHDEFLVCAASLLLGGYLNGRLPENQVGNKLMEKKNDWMSPQMAEYPKELKELHKELHGDYDQNKIDREMQKLSIKDAKTNLKCDDPMILLTLAIVIMEYGLQRSPYNYALRVLLSQAYYRVGAFHQGCKLIHALDLKHVQWDTLSYLVLPQSICGGVYTEAAKMLAVAENMFTGYKRESMEHIITVYKYGTFSKLHEFLEFRSQLLNSNQCGMTCAEKRLLELSTSVTSASEIRKQIESIFRDTNKDEDLCPRENTDNRDITILDFFIEQVDLDALRACTSEMDTYYRRIRQALLYSLVGFVGFPGEANSNSGHGGRQNHPNLSKYLQVFASLIDLWPQEFNDIEAKFQNTSFKGLWPPPYLPYFKLGCANFVHDMLVVGYEVLASSEVPQLQKTEETLINRARVMLNLLSSNPVEKNNSLLVYDEHFNKLHFVLETFSFVRIIVETIVNFAKTKSGASKPESKKKKQQAANAGLTLKKPYVQLQEVMLNKTEELSTFLMNAYVPTKDQGFDGLLEQKAYLDELVGSSFLQVAFSECYSTMLTNVTESYAVQIEEMRKLSTSLVEYVRNFEL